jgi:glycyl-tRNA synthetase beta chain
MPQLLLELFSEEIPARMQKRAEEDLARLLHEKFLVGTGHASLSAETFSSPRRIGAVINDLKLQTDEPVQTRKGPKVGAPAAAIEGFLKSTGLKSIDEAEIKGEPGKQFYEATYRRPSLSTAAVLQTAIPEIIRAFPWPKSMRSGTGDLQWVRPLQNILCLFDGKHVPISVDNVPSEAKTWGHRFHAPGAIEPKDAADHAAKLRAAKVEIDREARKACIMEGAKKACAAQGLELVEDIGLLEEVAGLVEWPVVILGDMDSDFLNLPGEVIRLSMRTHQKYFAVRDPKTKSLAPHFITVANVDAKDGGKAIAAGNARVLSARLSDAQFFWATDTKTPLFTEERKEKLKKIVFHQKLGSVWDKVERVKALAEELCAVTGAEKKLVAEAANLCKMDLVTETVGEFPELQGQVGRQLYALERGANASIAAAIEDHYRPLGPNDRVPSDPVAVTLALADKLDTLVGFWAIDEKPTGSSDAFGLRRAALGLVRTILASATRVSARQVAMLSAHPMQGVVQTTTVEEKSYEVTDALVRGAIATERVEITKPAFKPIELVESLVAFLADRLKVQLRDQGKRHDLVDAVFALGDDDLVRIVARVGALDALLKTEDGANLLAGYKRAANILAAEEKKGKGLSADDIAQGLDAKLLSEPAEKALNEALEKALPAARAAVEKEDFAAAMKALAGLRAPVDAFFDKVLVNAPEEQVRRNRLLLLSRFREALSAVADFSKIEG